MTQGCPRGNKQTKSRPPPNPSVKPCVPSCVSSNKQQPVKTHQPCRQPCSGLLLVHVSSHISHKHTRACVLDSTQLVRLYVCLHCWRSPHAHTGTHTLSLSANVMIFVSYAPHEACMCQQAHECLPQGTHRCTTGALQGCRKGRHCRVQVQVRGHVPLHEQRMLLGLPSACIN
jgi:hypothetical protein